jgi:hypothetical protein
MKKHLIYWLAAFVIVMVGCQKELSFEGSNTPAKGSLQADITGDCLPKTVNGTYVAASPLVPATNTISLQVNVVKTGTYIVTTDTVNGFYFRATGTFTTLGATNVTLRGNGTPFAPGVNNFVVNFDSTFCDIQVTVLPAGSGPAAFTLTGAPGSCGTPTINGVYAKDVPLTATNTVQLNVNVTIAGTYNVTTAVTNGMIFSGSGTLATGPQTITLTGTGTPVSTGNTTIPVTAGASTCSFVINVIAAVTGTLGGGPGACTPVTVNGNYYQNFALTAANTVQVQITTASVGPYIVSTNTVAGFSFSGSGTSTGATQTITLNGTGTPTATGPQNFTVTFGTSTCTFTVTVSAGGAFIADCSTAIVNGTYQAGTPLNSFNTVDIDINVTSLGPFNISTTATNGMTFSLAGTFTVLGVQTITLVGTGTPTAQGTFNIPMPGTTPCTFPVTCAPAPVISWSFKIGTTTYQGSTFSASLDASTPPFTLFSFEGDNAALDDILFDFIDLTGGIINNENYDTKSQGLTNVADFYFTDGAGTLDLAADPFDTSVGIIFKVTLHNTATKTITGTFTGTAFDSVSSTIKTITNGTFTIIYP